MICIFCVCFGALATACGVTQTVRVSQTLDGDTIVKSSTTIIEVDQHGNETIIEEIPDDSAMLQKQQELEDLLYGLGLQFCMVTLQEFDGMTSFQIGCKDENAESKVDEMLAIMEENLERIDYKNSKITDLTNFAENHNNAKNMQLYP